MPFLQLKNLHKTYPDGTHAVRGIDLDVQEGEFIVLLGPSGCGKTTTLRMIAGLEMPTDGQITLAKKEITHHPASKRDIGFVFQFYALYPHMTVHQNIAFPLENLGQCKQEMQTTLLRVSKSLGIEHLLDRHPGQLSGGDQQRVSLARAMVRQPDIYLMDEPLGTLDADHRLALREFIRSQQLALGVTAIYVTHDQEEAMSLADRIVVMESGHIRQIGTPSEIYHYPADLFVANFVGSPGMNLIEGKISSQEQGLFKASSAEIAIPSLAYTGPLTLGIRPEFIYPTDKGISARVSIIEYHGSHHDIHLDTPMGNLTMRTPLSVTLSPKDNIQIAFKQNEIRLFAPKTGHAIL
ncbi:MAG: ABC transporter ATP-binding protein [Candidatus Latescibacteria bacterium]|jgi:multiple sugar transport system ATP-binding protein|nr:ABC transporter ATP-binding protein [Candidatus Latescibacterota bacterium]MBT5832719.1 ABC transporter ATP-binding protein [Candidatus Latescibacterota bacterium]